MNAQTFIHPPIDDETLAHQERTAKIRFKQNIIHGIGAAMVFGLATAAFSSLFEIASSEVAVSGAAGALTNAAAGTIGILGATFSVTTLAWVGIAAAVMVGFGCLYLSSKYTSELVSLEQNRHAKEIAKGINGKTPAIEPQKPAPFPSKERPPVMLDVAQEMNTAKPQVSQVQLQDKVVSLDAHRSARANA
jgi:hypothetical protein